MASLALAKDAMTVVMAWEDGGDEVDASAEEPRDDSALSMKVESAKLAEGGASATVKAAFISQEMKAPVWKPSVTMKVRSSIEHMIITHRLES